MKVERISVSRISMSAWNPRKDYQPGDPEYEHLRRSLREFGVVQPLVWNARSGNLVGGHQRLRILIANGETEVDVVAVDLPTEQEKALNLALNQVHGDWDNEKLALLLEELTQVPDFDIKATGFSVPEVADLLAHGAGPASERQEEALDFEASLHVHGEPVTQPGEMFCLGSHRLLCGDAANGDDVARLMGATRADLVLADMPHSRSHGGRRAGGPHVDTGGSGGEKTRCRRVCEGRLTYLRRALAGARDVAAEECPLYLKFDFAQLREALDTLTSAGWCERHLLVLPKRPSPRRARAHYISQHHLCFYCSKRGDSPHWFGPLNDGDVRAWDEPAEGLDHPATLAVRLRERAIVNSSTPGHAVLDLFLGSGTTLIAAARTGRRCLAVEGKPGLCDVAIRRYLAFAGEGQVDAALAERYRKPQGGRS